MNLSEFIDKKCIIEDLKATTKEDAIKELVQGLRSNGILKGAGIQVTVNALMEREQKGTTGIGDGVAVPHAKIKGIKNIIGAFGRSEKGINFNSVDGADVHLIFLQLSPEKNAEEHINTLQHVAMAIKQPNFCRFLRNAKTIKEIYELFKEIDEILVKS